MTGQKKAKIQVRDKDNVVLASSMLHRDVEARRAELRDPDAVESTRSDVMSLSRRLEEMDSKVDIVDAMLAGDGLSQSSDIFADMPGVGDDLPSPDTPGLDDLPALELDEVPADGLPLDDEPVTAPSSFDVGEFGDDLPSDDLPLAEDGQTDLLLDPVPGDTGAAVDELPPYEDLPALDDLPSEDLLSADEAGIADLPAEETLAEAMGDDLPSADDLPADDDLDAASSGSSVDLDGLLAQAAADGDEPAGLDDLDLENESGLDPFDDEGEASIAGLSLEDGGSEGPLEIGQVDISKLRARRPDEEAAPVRKPAPLKLTTDMLANDTDLPAADDEEAEDADAAILSSRPEVDRDDETVAPLKDPFEEDAGAGFAEESFAADTHPDLDLPDPDLPEAELDVQPALTDAADDLPPADDLPLEDGLTPVGTDDFYSGDDLPSADDLPPVADLPGDDELPRASNLADDTGPASFRPLTETEAREHEEISARAVEITAADNGLGDDDFVDDGFFAPDTTGEDPYHDLDLGNDPEQDDDDEDDRDIVTPIDEDEPVAVAANMNVDSEKDRLAIFDMSGDTGAREANAGETRTAENGDEDMSFMGLRKPARTAKDTPADDVELKLEDDVNDTSLPDSDDLDQGDAEEQAETKVAKKSGKMGKLLRSAAVIAVLLGGGVFGAMKMGVIDVDGSAQLADLQQENTASAALDAPVDPFAPIAGPGVQVPALADSSQEPQVDPRDLAFTEPAGGADDTLAEQLARAASGDLGNLAPAPLATPAIQADVPVTLDDTPLAAPEGTDYNPEDAFANIPDSDDTIPEEEVAAPAPLAPVETVAPAAAPVTPRPTPAAGSLDAAMSAFLSGYITAEELEARMGAYTTAATTAEIENRLGDYLKRIEDLDGQMSRLGELETRIGAAIEQADRAEQLAIAQNDLVVEVVRMKGKVDMAESLIVDLSRRIASMEQLDPADRVAVDRTLADLNSRVENMARDIGLIARVAIKGESAFAPAPTPAPTAAAGDVFARQGGDAPRPPTRLDPSKVPADVKKGDYLEGYGHVLDVMPTERGKMVVTENDSVIIQ